jgi:hypothetical protein
MGALFGGGPKAPAPQAPIIPAPAPVRDDVTGSAAGERMRLAALRGRGATLLGAPGAYAAAPDQRRVLLGVSE